MAITDEYPDLKAHILVNGVPLEEYEDDDEEVRSDAVVKYIEAKSGANFQLRFSWSSLDSVTNDFVARVCLDGKWAYSLVFYRNKEASSGHKSISSVRERIGDQYFSSDFSFSPLQTDDRDLGIESKHLVKTLQKVGEIKFELEYGEFYNDHETAALNSSFTELDTVPEKALKGRAVSHQTNLQKPKPTLPFRSVDMRSIDHKPFATFRFKYRSREALKSLMVIPRSPSPIPLEERDINGLSSEEMRELLQRQRERGEAASFVKREGVKRERMDSDNNDPLSENANGVDGEVTFVSSKRRRFPVTLNEDGVEVVDLC